MKKNWHETKYYTFKATTCFEAIESILKNIAPKNKTIIQELKSSWTEIAPEWAKIAIPYMIKNNTLFIQVGNNAAVLQYRQSELLKIAQTINNKIEHVKIIR